MVEVILTCTLMAGQIFVPPAGWKILNVRVAAGYLYRAEITRATETTIRMSQKINTQEAFKKQLLPNICGGAIIEIADKVKGSE